MEIVWKNAKTVGFGQKGQHLVAWYCASPAPNLSALVDGTDYDKGKTCETGADPTLYNSCMNTAAVEAANSYRSQHKVAAFEAITSGKDNEKAAGDLYKKLNAAPTCVNGLEKTAIAIPAATCLDIFYQVPEADKTHSAIAKGMTAAWYAHKENYDFATGKPINGKTYDDVAGLTAMLWKGAVPATDYAAFAVKAGCAAARFCVKINEQVLASGAVKQPDTADKYKPNVLKQCINSDGLDFCYEEAQVEEVNR